MDSQVRFVGPLERAVYLKSATPLRNLSPVEIATVSRLARERTFRKGEHLLRRGEPLGSLHFLVEGRVQASGGEYGRGRLLEGPAELGLLSLLGRSETGLEVVAAEDVVTLELFADDLSDVFEDHFDSVLRQMQSVAGILLDLRRRLTPDGAVLAPAEGLAEVDTDRELGLIDRLLFLLRGGSDRTNLEVWVTMARITREVRFPAGTEIWRAGDPCGFFYMLVSGTVRCEHGEDGRSFTAGTGYPMGNLESVAREPRWFTATTETPVVALRAETELFFDLMEDHFAVAQDYMASMASGALRLLDQAAELGLDTRDSNGSAAEQKKPGVAAGLS